MANSVPNLVKISETAAELWRFSFFPKWRPAAILDFVTGQKWRHGRLRTVHVYHHAKFGDSIWNGGRVIAILRFQYGGLRRLGFCCCWKMTLGDSHQHNKYGEGISNSGWVMQFSFFHNGGRPQYWILLDFVFRPPTKSTWRPEATFIILCQPVYTFEDIAVSIFRNLA